MHSTRSLSFFYSLSLSLSLSHNTLSYTIPLSLHLLIPPFYAIFMTLYVMNGMMLQLLFPLSLFLLHIHSHTVYLSFSSIRPLYAIFINLRYPYCLAMFYLALVLDNTILVYDLFKMLYLFIFSPTFCAFLFQIWTDTSC